MEHMRVWKSEGMRVSYLERMTGYFEAIAKLWVTLSEEEQAAFQDWKDTHPASKNSDWPGWQPYLGSVPRRTEVVVVRGGMTA